MGPDGDFLGVDSPGVCRISQVVQEPPDDTHRWQDRHVLSNTEAQTWNVASSERSMSDLFAWFLLFLVVVFWFLAGTARWTAYRSTTITFVAIDK